MMITRERFDILCSPEVRRAIDLNIERDPVAVALDKHIPYASEVATQVKYLQRARRKLPSYYAARCIMPSLAFEQSSSEECALRKPLSGASALDLTCGLGVDSFALSCKFDRVTAVERDEVLAEIARENFRRLGVDNVEVVCDTAENFIASARERFDWCFADPDRRSAEGKKMVVLEDCSPDMVRLLPVLRPAVADRVCIKVSPMFDVDEAFRLFGDCTVETVSLGDECKEVLIYIDGGGARLSAVAAGVGEFSVDAADRHRPAAEGEFAPESYRWLILPDVSLRKARLSRLHLDGKAFTASDNGFGFAAERPEGVLGRMFEIESVERFDPRRLRREMKGVRADIMLRDVPLTLQSVERMTGIRSGGSIRMAITSVGGEIWVVKLK